ncbi:GGDEF domain-containing protein [Faecalicatena contorta]|uniref:Putative two-component system response regulator n=1 Tax=Faecalicatena contorta TaxID=39482 RepID=A0A316A0C7_9FIRM|nr:GGDEF domain-containing protein [Faecalicatena contorta]PWJ50989.1 putative two-component system response regulator [Faecalicatena contorta]SUQ13557.1 putative two-component system response regulator [Faecalicatena contorta]
MTKEELVILMGELERVFSTVRLVDASLNIEYTLNDAGMLREEPYKCYAVWGKNDRCENCISAKGLTTKSKMTKFEFIDHDIYYLVSMYVEIEDEPYMLEMISQVTDETLFGAYGKNEFVTSITEYNRKMYTDVLTGAYNRRYYEEQLEALCQWYAMAMVDVDDFKQINDIHGHEAGDLALRAIADAMSSCVEGRDAVVRYGGDEFLIVFRDISQEGFEEKLETIRKKVNDIVLESFPDIRLSVSIGGKYNPSKSKNVIREADAMLYKAKIDKNCVQWKADI